MNPPAPELVELAKALARAAVARDLAAHANTKGRFDAHSHLRSLQLRSPE
jgi:hypothetical protein